MPANYGSFISLYNDDFLEAYKQVVDDVKLPRDVHSSIIDSFTDLLNSIHSEVEIDKISYLSRAELHLFVATNKCYIYLNSLTRSEIDEFCKNPKNIEKFCKIPPAQFKIKVDAFKKASEDSREITLRDRATKQEQIASIKREAQFAIALRNSIDYDRYKTKDLRLVRFIRSRKDFLTTSGLGAFGLWVSFETIKYIWPSVLATASWAWNNASNISSQFHPP